MSARHLLFLTATYRRRHQPAYRAIEILPPPWRDDSWPAWLYEPAPRAVTVLPARESINHASTDHGSVWTCDGVPIPEQSDRQWLERVGANLSNSVSFKPPVEGLRLPAFLGSQSDLRPCRYSLLVRMKVKVFADLPDFKAELAEQAGTSHAFMREMSEIVGEAKGLKNWKNPFLVQIAAAAERTGLPEGQYLPVEAERDDHRVFGALRLDEEWGPGVFQATAFMSDGRPKLTADMVLSRRAERHLADRAIRFGTEIATVVRAGEPTPIAAGGPDAPFGGREDGPDVTISCIRCGGRFTAERFTPQELEVMEQWGECRPYLKEMPLLERTAKLYERYPEARGQVRSRPSAIVHSDDPVVRQKLAAGVPFGQIDPPRPSDYERKLREWVDGDPELLVFLETTTFDLEARTKAVREALQTCQKRIAGRKVVCPACHKGALALDMHPAV